MKNNIFIDRPILSMVLSILIVILGIIGIMALPIEQYPQITPPIVKVSTSYPGANATTMSQAVATPLEQELNGTPGMLYMESSSTNAGSLTVTITFDPGVDTDLAAIEVQNRVKLAESRLPAEVIQNGITVEKQSPNQLMTVSLTSSDAKYDEIYLSNYATINVIDVLRRIPGIGRISNVGGRYYGMQIWVYPDKMASFSLTVKDLQAALKDQNREAAVGEFGKQPISGIDVSIPITAQGRLSSVSEFEDIVVKASPDGSFIRMKDIARVSLEAASYNTESELNGENAVILTIYTLPGANSIEIGKKINEEMERLSKDFPAGISYLIPFDVTKYINESIHEVYKTLFEALFLVIVVVFLSLQSWRASLIPIVAVPISLIGTFAFMLVMGYSLNMLTLLGLILAIGIVVDDAIVVVENVERIMETQHLSPREATHVAMKELTGALIATSLVLGAVFVPVSFLDGIVGSMYRQFSITIVVSVLISCFVALTLSPAMCAMLLRPHNPNEKKNKFFTYINNTINKGNTKYGKILTNILNNPRRVIGLFGMAIVFIFVLNRFIPTGFVPAEDQGYFTVELELPEGTTLERTREITGRAIDYLNDHKSVDYVQSVVGSGPRTGTNQSRANLTVVLKPWEERSQSVEEVMTDVREEYYKYPEIRAYLSMPAVISGLGSAGGIEFKLQAKSGATMEDLALAVDSFNVYANQSPELQSVSSALQSNIPQLYFDVNRDQAMQLGIPLADIFATLKAYLGSIYINDFNMFNRIYRVYIQADENFRKSEGDLNLFFVRSGSGQMIPLSALGSLKYTTGAGNITRFNMYTSASMQANPQAGVSSGKAMQEIESIVRNKLPENISVAWSGLSYQENKASGQTGVVFFLVILFVFLFLSALYESWTVPLAVILCIPVALLGAYFGVFATRLTNDIYFQIGLVTLIGMAAKNAILIVEFAKQQVDSGVDAMFAASEAIRLRFRPILMTSLAFVLGMVPLVLSSGPGAGSRHSIGTGIFFGMIFSTLLGTLIVPYFFVMIYRLKNKFNIPDINFKAVPQKVAKLMKKNN